jgi:alkylation response protein AidB-like acyl-CoA dehydrogenase
LARAGSERRAGDLRGADRGRERRSGDAARDGAPRRLGLAARRRQGLRAGGHARREPQARLELDGAKLAGDALLEGPGAGAAIVDWMLDRALVALCATQIGVSDEALKRTAEYIRTRRQFGRAIASFQGVALRAADAYIDLEAMRSTLLQAAWRVAAGLPAGPEVAAAKWWACRGGQRIAHTAQHLHGGIGADIDYPIHRFFLWSKHLDITLGGASRQLVRLGQMLAGEPRAEGTA